MPKSTLYHHLWQQDGVAEEDLIGWSLDCLMPENKLFIDVGANTGAWSLKFARSQKVSFVVSFEPNKELYDCLFKSMVLNGFYKKSRVEDVALGSPEQSGPAKFYETKPDGVSSSLHPEFLDMYIKVGYKEEVDVIVKTLDQLDITNIGLVKIDAEGAELDIFRGAVKTLENNGWPKIIFEAWDSEWFAKRKQETLNFLINLGYKIIPVNYYPHMFVAER